jgi:hypothetical protein
MECLFLTLVLRVGNNQTGYWVKMIGSNEISNNINCDFFLVKNETQNRICQFGDELVMVMAAMECLWW